MSSSLSGLLTLPGSPGKVLRQLLGREFRPGFQLGLDPVRSGGCDSVPTPAPACSPSRRVRLLFSKAAASRMPAGSESDCTYPARPFFTRKVGAAPAL